MTQGKQRQKTQLAIEGRMNSKQEFALKASNWVPETRLAESNGRNENVHPRDPFDNFSVNLFRVRDLLLVSVREEGSTMRED